MANGGASGHSDIGLMANGEWKEKLGSDGRST